MAVRGVPYVPVSDPMRKRLFEDRVERWGRGMTFFLPGMFVLDGQRGRYPAVSVTGTDCELQCRHCRGVLLSNMLSARGPNDLQRLARGLSRDGTEGVLLTGGCDAKGKLSFDGVMSGVSELKKQGLYVSVHAGMSMSTEAAGALSCAGVDQALLDIVVDDATARWAWGLPTADIIGTSLDTMLAAGLEVVPHLVVGMYKGRIRGEYEAVDFLKDYRPRLLSVVVFMPHVAMKDVQPPPPGEVIDVLAYARRHLSETEVSLGCARPRGTYRYELEERAIECGVTRMALWSDRAVRAAAERGLEASYRYTCCSVRTGEESPEETG
jgi:uncharacterized radical SAM superfamily protein